MALPALSSIGHRLLYPVLQTRLTLGLGTQRKYSGKILPISSNGWPTAFSVRKKKINHALLLGGKQGIGKDTLLEPVKQAIGPWNFAEVSPQNMLGRFNGFLIRRVSEARDLGDVDRFQFYDHMKAYAAAPPDVLRVDRRHFVARSELGKDDFTPEYWNSLCVGR
jgi:hypothetical protein